ncbi:MAG: IBR domain-containing protein [Sedimentisphaerales bacterium]|jgi:rubrerythrin
MNLAGILSLAKSFYELKDITMAEKKTEKLEETDVERKTETSQNFSFCPRCGNTITGDMVNTLCPECGYRFCPSCID